MRNKTKFKGKLIEDNEIDLSQDLLKVGEDTDQTDCIKLKHKILVEHENYTVESNAI